MNKTNIDQALAALADALKGHDPSSFLDNPKEFVKKIPHRSLSGDHIDGGKILNFSSSGISDRATSEVLNLTDQGLIVHKFAKGFAVEDTVQVKNLNTESVNSTDINCQTLKASKIIGEIEYANDNPVIFKSDSLDGKGMLWVGKGYTKQLVFSSNPDRIFISESLDLGKGKSISINNVPVLDEKTLGTSITKSYLKEVGRLNGLIVEGTASIAEYFYFDSNANRLGIGTEQPHATLSIFENNVELVFGTTESSKAYIGTFAGNDLSIITDNQSRINITSEGNITLGNFKSVPVQVSINGKLAIKVNNPDPDVDLHVNGAVKFQGKLQTRGSGIPDGGYYNKGDIVWNDDPTMGSYVGWICLQSGTPGNWLPFGKIGYH